MKKEKKKQQGKRKFRKFFWWRFWLCFAVCGALCAQNTYKLLKSIAESQTEIGSVRLGFKRPIDTYVEQYDCIESALSTLRVCDTGMETAVMIYQPETGEFFTGEPCAKVSIWQDGQKKSYWLHDQDTLERLEDASTGIWNMDYYDTIVYSVYIKNDMFMPGEVFARKKSIFIMPGREMVEGKQQSGEWIDLSPADTEGWTKIVNDKSKESLTVFSYDNDPDKEAEERSADGKQHLGEVGLIGSANGKRAIAMMNEMKTRMPEAYKGLTIGKANALEQAEHGAISLKDLKNADADNRAELIEKKEARYSEEIRKIPMRIYDEFTYYYRLGPKLNIRNYYGCIEEETLTYKDQEWELFVFRYSDLYILTQMTLIYYWYLFLIDGLLLPLLLALFWAAVTYLRYSKHYDIETYRVNLTNILAHDLKTPLAVICGNAENLREHTHPEFADDYADTILENAMHMDEMIAGVLGLAKLEHRAMPASKDPVDLTALLHSAFERNAALMESRGLTLKESGKLMLKGNTEMLTQLAENLASNAVQHASEGGTVTVTAEKNKLRISNPFEGTLDAKTVCEPFRRGDAARGSQSGSGLGLSFVRQIAALQKLRLRITAKDGVFTAELKRKRFSRMKKQ